MSPSATEPLVIRVRLRLAQTTCRVRARSTSRPRSRSMLRCTSCPSHYMYVSCTTGECWLDRLGCLESKWTSTCNKLARSRRLMYLAACESDKNPKSVTGSGAEKTGNDGVGYGPRPRPLRNWTDRVALFLGRSDTGKTLQRWLGFAEIYG